MLWKIIVIVAAFFLFRRARRRRPALTCLKLWRKTLYRRHKPVEAELLRVEERNGTNLLVCDVPSLQKHALICGASFWRSATGLRMRLMIIAVKQMIRTRR